MKHRALEGRLWVDQADVPTAVNLLLKGEYAIHLQASGDNKVYIEYGIDAGCRDYGMYFIPVSLEDYENHAEFFEMLETSESKI